MGNESARRVYHALSSLRIDSHLCIDTPSNMQLSTILCLQRLPCLKIRRHCLSLRNAALLVFVAIFRWTFLDIYLPSYNRVTI